MRMVFNFPDRYSPAPGRENRSLSTIREVRLELFHGYHPFFLGVELELNPIGL
jgi:hypothetical protein